MKKKEQYRILKYEYFNQYSEVTNEYYYIQKFSANWWGLWRWRDITYNEYYYATSYEVRTSFETMESAEVFINTKLCTGLPKSDDRSTVLKTFECEK